ncbi:hypothetical protein TNCV_2529801 [Trichonephila clavipes]|nr:hypothetical protein TNCV_2529801 [Trichonephila clavipes]
MKQHEIYWRKSLTIITSEQYVATKPSFQSKDLRQDRKEIQRQREKLLIVGASSYDPSRISIVRSAPRLFTSTISGGFYDDY